MVKVQEVTITKAVLKGTNRVAWNVDLNGKPFGQIWTFKARGEIHPFHAKTLSGEYRQFATYKAAETFMRGEM